MIEKTYNVGIYCRLSNDDERDGESVSIENQKLLLQGYVRQMGWNEYNTYCDDGYSGTNFNRPAVKQLLEDAKAKRINLILVKDLSRFGRNYIEFGQYTDYLFPSLGCRFIALNNGIDTESSNGSTDVMCFLNLFNEFYSRDTSKKVKAVKRACAESGKFMGTYPAYGYRRDPMDKHHLIIDEETAPTVRRIFAMRASGMGYRSIALQLNSEGILPPGVLYYQRKGQSDPRNVNHQWAEETIKSILVKEVYLGHMVQGRCGTLSYKSRKLVSKPQEEWIRVENTHEPLVSQELWVTCMSLMQKKVRKSPTADGIQSIFTGLVYCADCGFKMRNLIERFTYKDGRPGRYSSFLCGNYARSGKTACTTHTISRSYKDATMVCKPEADWIIHEGAHPAIISQAVWTAVQKINRKAASASKHNTPCLPGLFSGKLVCADCGAFLSATRETRHSRSGAVKKYVSYYCSRHTTSGRSTCSWHRIYEKPLQQIVESEIKLHAEALALDEAAMVDKLKKRLASQDSIQLADARGELGKLRRRIQELEQMTAKLYEDKVTGAISPSAFSVLVQKSEQERMQKAERLEELQTQLKLHEQDEANIQKWVELIRKQQNRQELDRETVEELIDHIEIGERTICDGQRYQEIKIYYRFVGLMA